MMNLDGLEMIAVLVVMGLFIKVLEQFGLFEPVGGEGNRPSSFSCVTCFTVKKSKVVEMLTLVLRLCSVRQLDRIHGDVCGSPTVVKREEFDYSLQLLALKLYPVNPCTPLTPPCCASVHLQPNQ